VRRRHLLWYGAEVGESPVGLPPANWPEHHTGRGELPEEWPTWREFWAESRRRAQRRRRIEPRRRAERALAHEPPLRQRELCRRFVHSAGIEILVVCTGNACRSPMAAALLARHLADRGVDAKVGSAGTRSWDIGATEDAVSVMSERGLDIAEHANRQLTPDLVDRADLVVGMTREHVAIATARCPDAAERAFLVGELARLGRAVGPRGADETVRDWLARVADTRPAERPLGRWDDEVGDPVGEPIGVYRDTVAVLDRHLSVIADLLAGRSLE
jgi:protein-tyrosine phosphatase